MGVCIVWRIYYHLSKNTDLFSIHQSPTMSGQSPNTYLAMLAMTFIDTTHVVTLQLITM